MHGIFFLAPMAELSHRALRELIEGFGGCDEYYTEMISAGGLLGGGPFEKWYLDPLPRPEKLVYQLAGSGPDQIFRAAALLDRRDCAGIDINMGCSAPAIRRTGAGVAWMADMDQAENLIAGLRKMTKKRLSVKLRIGFEDDFDYLLRFCRRLEEAGLDCITLHPRTAREKLRRTARWDYVGRLKEGLGIPVAGNGDIQDAAALVRRASSGLCDAVMVGRGAVRQPWIFAAARRLETAAESGPAAGAKPVNLEETALRFLELLARHQPPEFHHSRARRFFACYADNLKWGGGLKNRLQRETGLAAMAGVLTDYFREHPEERELSAPGGSLLP
ncbi:MAG: tRNA-dihydrouridine synthase family protein [Treponema sp.]|jgi:tRNA-dihydrouridine synthase|nr:tRNA-dihydrouridine synthase family protein [Treponema sp.]